MIELENIREIVSTYERHGWMLRRFLLTARSKKSLLESPIAEFDGVPILDSVLDAAWFSRPPTDGGVAWELRYLGLAPFALVEQIDEAGPDLEQKLSDVEQRLRDAISKKVAA